MPKLSRRAIPILILSVLALSIIPSIMPVMALNVDSRVSAMSEFEISDLEIKPEEVEKGLKVEVSVKVSNVGGKEGTHTVHLYVNGKAEGLAEVTLAAGESHIVYFNVEKGAGTYKVEVDGLTGRFIVFVNPARPFWMRPIYVAGIIIIIVSTAAAAYALLRRRPDTRVSKA